MSSYQNSNTIRRFYIRIWESGQAWAGPLNPQNCTSVIVVNHAGAWRLEIFPGSRSIARASLAEQQKSASAGVCTTERRPDPQPGLRSWAMTIDRWHFRRPEGERRNSTVRLPGYRRHFRQSTVLQSPMAFDNNVDRVADEAMKAALAGEARDDITFGEYASLFGFFRSAVMQEGRLLETAIEQAVQRNPDLKLLPTKPMPIVPAAQEMLKRTPSDEIKGVRFPSRVHATESYKPDLFVVNRQNHSGLILDIKRSLGSYRPQEVDRLRFRMLAVATIAPEWVAERQGPLLVNIETAIVDGANEVSDPERGVFRLSEIDDLLESEGAAEFVRQVREAFSQRVQDELARRCRTLTGNLVEPASIADMENPTTDDPTPSAGEPDSVVPLQTPVMAQPRFGYARRPGLH